MSRAINATGFCYLVKEGDVIGPATDVTFTGLAGEVGPPDDIIAEIRFFGTLTIFAIDRIICSGPKWALGSPYCSQKSLNLTAASSSSRPSASASAARPATSCCSG